MLAHGGMQRITGEPPDPKAQKHQLKLRDGEGNLNTASFPVGWGGEGKGEALSLVRTIILQAHNM